MEMLQAKQEQEKKRLREQMEAEAAVQRQQMENMVKARMMEVEKHRRNFKEANGEKGDCLQCFLSFFFFFCLLCFSFRPAEHCCSKNERMLRSLLMAAD